MCIETEIRANNPYVFQLNTLCIATQGVEQFCELVGKVHVQQHPPTPTPLDVALEHTLKDQPEQFFFDDCEDQLTVIRMAMHLIAPFSKGAAEVALRNTRPCDSMTGSEFSPWFEGVKEQSFAEVLLAITEEVISRIDVVLAYNHGQGELFLRAIERELRKLIAVLEEISAED